MTRVAAIDCGTNSIRLLSPTSTRRRTLVDLDRRMEIVRLGQGVDGPGGSRRRRWSAPSPRCAATPSSIAGLGAERVRFVATSATRDAANRDEFVAACASILGVEPEVVTGDEEAALSFAGATRDSPRAARAARTWSSTSAAARPSSCSATGDRRGGAVGRHRLRADDRAAPARRPAHRRERSRPPSPTSTRRSRPLGRRGVPLDATARDPGRRWPAPVTTVAGDRRLGLAGRTTATGIHRTAGVDPAASTCTRWPARLLHALHPRRGARRDRRHAPRPGRRHRRRRAGPRPRSCATSASPTSSSASTTSSTASPGRWSEPASATPTRRAVRQPGATRDGLAGRPGQRPDTPVAHGRPPRYVAAGRRGPASPSSTPAVGVPGLPAAGRVARAGRGRAAPVVRRRAVLGAARSPGWGDRRRACWSSGWRPAAHGGNRTGRIFTGDRSGDWLFASLHRVGPGRDPPTSTHAGDGQRLLGARMVAPVRCAPPANKPTPAERDTCAPWLRPRAGARRCRRCASVVALGGVRLAGRCWPVARGRRAALPRGRGRRSATAPRSSRTGPGGESALLLGLLPPQPAEHLHRAGSPSRCSTRSSPGPGTTPGCPEPRTR